MKLTVTPTALDGVLLLNPVVHGDARGFFCESFNARDFEAATGQARLFVQDNHSRSGHGVLRGIHYQVGRPQAKLVHVVVGEIFDVAVDLRRTSPSFGKWTGAVLSAENKIQIWIPEGFGHGFLVTSEVAEVLYKSTEYWSPAHEHGVVWNDSALAIDWPMAPLAMSTKDASAPALADATVFD
jgi:dTDP-4-dehydrorhamnose 3,5-epimerase